MKSITLQMFLQRLATVRRDNPGLERHDAPLMALVDGKIIPLTTGNFMIEDDATLVISTGSETADGHRT